jgi:beta-glucosidase
LGQVTRAGGSSNLLPEETAELMNSVQRFLLDNTRLGIPAMNHEECCSGYMARGATVYPQAIGVASTWDPQYAERMAAGIREEMRSVGAHQALSPVLDVTRDPRWGRTEETFGEDQRLVADMGVAYVKGLQGDGPGDGGIMATAKHLVGYGMTEGGMNWTPAHIPPRELRQVFLYPFEMAIKEAGLTSVMNAYHELDGIPCAANEWLLKDMLRDRLGFDGLVVSDYFAIDMIKEFHAFAEDKAEAAAFALRAGIDVELPGTDCYGAPLLEAIQRGLVEEHLVDRSVRRVLRAKFELGLFENPFVPVERVRSVFSRPEPVRLAEEIATKSLVLLKNASPDGWESALLPLPSSIRKLAVIGPNAHTARNMVGDYAYPCHIEALLDPGTIGSQDLEIPEELEKLDYLAGVPSVLDGLRELVGDRVEIVFEPGCEVSDSDRSGFAAAANAAQDADAAVLVVGGRSGLTNDCTCGEARDKAEVTLPGVQEELVRAVAATGTPIVLAVVGGRPFALTGVIDHVDAILLCWLPGQTGARPIARVLFGESVPGGKLPISLPRSSGQIPVFYSHKPSGGRSYWLEDYVDMSSRPLFAFGHGLSYTQFSYSDLKLAPSGDRSAIAFRAECTITNVGDHAGDEVAQVYVHDVKASVTRPVKELIAYRRLSLEPGESRTIAWEIPPSRLEFVGIDGEFLFEPGEFVVMVGSASDDIRLEGRVRVA